MLSLGIESSCDETGVAVVEDGRWIISNIISSSLSLHQPFGGVVPEMASRAHLETINVLVRQALDQAKVDLNKIEHICVTYGPGLVGALLIGVSLAKAVSYAAGLPLVGVNHLWAHIYANFLSDKKSKGLEKQTAAPEFPFIGLIVSGGHTCLVDVQDFDSYELLGQTEDDAVGEAFDKVAKILGLGYPGGPVIDSISKNIDPDAVKFTRPYLKKDTLNFSFSGIKTQVLYYVKKEFGKILDKADSLELKKNKQAIAEIAAGFQEAVVDVLVSKALKACQESGKKELVLGGGVSVNSRLREKMKPACGEKGIKLFYPEPGLCTDNAAMVAGLGSQLYSKGRLSGLDLSAQANLGLNL